NGSGRSRCRYPRHSIRGRAGWRIHHKTNRENTRLRFACLSPAQNFGSDKNVSVGHCITRPSTMTDSPEPRKDTAHIAIPSARHGAGAGTDGSAETVRIHLPTRPPANPSVVPVPSSSTAVANVMPASAPMPKKENTRIRVSPDLPTAQTKARPLIDLSPTETPQTVEAVALQPSSTSPVEIPMFLCWGLL